MFAMDWKKIRCWMEFILDALGSVVFSIFDRAIYMQHFCHFTTPSYVSIFLLNRLTFHPTCRILK